MNNPKAVILNAATDLLIILLRTRSFAAFKMALLFVMVAIPAHAADPDSDVAERQQIFREMQAALDRLQANARPDPLAHKAELGEAAARMSELSAQPWALFGPATTITRRNTHAAPAIQGDPAGFRASAARFQAAALTLNATLLTKKDADAATLQGQVSDLAKSCETCHSQYMR